MRKRRRRPHVPVFLPVSTSPEVSHAEEKSFKGSGCVNQKKLKRESALISISEIWLIARAFHPETHRTKAPPTGSDTRREHVFHINSKRSWRANVVFNVVSQSPFILLGVHGLLHAEDAFEIISLAPLFEEGAGLFGPAHSSTSWVTGHAHIYLFVYVLTWIFEYYVEVFNSTIYEFTAVEDIVCTIICLYCLIWQHFRKINT